MNSHDKGIFSHTMVLMKKAQNTSFIKNKFLQKKICHNGPYSYSLFTYKLQMKYFVKCLVS